jgi:bacterioferritin-associated ferredoxin
MRTVEANPESGRSPSRDTAASGWKLRENARKSTWIENDVESRFQDAILMIADDGAPPMIVCLCKGVSCGAVRRSIEDGARDLSAVGRACGAGSDCGVCHAEIDAMLREADADRSGPRMLPVLPSNAPDRAA